MRQMWITEMEETMSDQISNSTNLSKLSEIADQAHASGAWWKSGALDERRSSSRRAALIARALLLSQRSAFSVRGSLVFSASRPTFVSAGRDVHVRLANPKSWKYPK